MTRSACSELLQRTARMLPLAMTVLTSWLLAGSVIAGPSAHSSGGAVLLAATTPQTAYDDSANLARQATANGGGVDALVRPVVDALGPSFASSGDLSAPRASALKPGSAGGPTAGNRFPGSVRDAVKTENIDEFGELTCVYCRMGTETPHVDHVIPRVRGGDATLGNAQVTCPHCNLSKGARDFPVNPPDSYFGPWPPPWWGVG